jgi:hypothetical protein
VSDPEGSIENFERSGRLSNAEMEAKSVSISAD